MPRSNARVLLLAVALAAPAAIGAADKDRPSLSLRASPSIAFSPARIVLTADLKGGANDYQEYYCSTVEWDWGDGTRSQQTVDCEPYEVGKSEIKRHFVIDRIFRTAGDYRVEFRLKRKDKTLTTASTVVKIRPGVRDIGGSS
ncbi:MAG: hypothetical protein DMF85_19555 [Acidobacteria bacterium]|nr:MAG: hypothetical protein DMF85_19555 [Acidobacteriota bacterium]PYR80409.1 MAG: hypothetical protein DMF86_00850 [Acidobacteriota bacterium]